jgi:hypothetical protein
MTPVEVKTSVYVNMTIKELQTTVPSVMHQFQNFINKKKLELFIIMRFKVSMERAYH